MKTSKQDIQDLLAQLAADIEEIKAILNGNTAGATRTTSVIADAGTVGNGNAISNDVAANNPRRNRLYHRNRLRHNGQWHDSL